MLLIALFALIGVMIDAWLAYWIVFGVYCFMRVALFIIKFIEKGTNG